MLAMTPSYVLAQSLRDVIKFRAYQRLMGNFVTARLEIRVKVLKPI